MMTLRPERNEAGGNVDVVVEMQAVETPPRPRRSTRDENGSDTETKRRNSPNKSSDNVYRNVSSEALLSKPINLSEQCVGCERPGTKYKLRYIDIKPYDHSIVPLAIIDGQPLSDFINANFVNGYEKPNLFIAAQGPTKNTVVDHWRMVWEHNVRIIVMPTKFSEGGIEKCFEYFSEKEERQFGIFTVKVTSKEIFSDFTINTIVFKRAEESRTVRHFHYTAWPDKGVPDTGSTLLEFRRQIKQEEKDEGPPLLVHCSAGVGRTGAYIAIGYLLEQAEAEGLVDVCSCVNLMREHRIDAILVRVHYRAGGFEMGPQFITSEEQFNYLHELAIEYMDIFSTYANFKIFMTLFSCTVDV